MRELVFLPDRDGRDVFPEQEGFFRMGADASALSALANRLTAPEGEQKRNLFMDTVWRGVIALALLTDVWTECGSELMVKRIDGSASAFASWVLAARPEAERGKPLQLVLLCRDGVRRLLGVVDEHCGLRLPASPVMLAEVAPAGAGWIDRATGAIADPVAYLNERERMILLSRLQSLGLKTPQAAALMESLRHADAAEVEAVRSGDAEALERLAVRMEAVHGLQEFAAFSVSGKRYVPGGENPLLRALGVVEAAVEPYVEESRTYLWNGVPFAMTSRELGLTGVAHPQMQETLAQITAELRMMSANSVVWNHRTGKSLEAWLDSRRMNTALLPQARERIEASCALLRENGRQTQAAVTLTWPWDANSGAAQVLLKQALGEKWMKAAAAPFADRLTILNGRTLGDLALQRCCQWEDGVLLPPLSREMAACVAQADEGTGLALDAMHFEPQPDGGVTASFLLRGEGEVQMVRSYPPEEILVLTEDAAPCVAVWPCLPMKDWHAYHVFVRGGAEISALGGGEWHGVAPVAQDLAQGIPMPGQSWRCLKTTEYPACLSLSLYDLCLGALPNMLPACQTAGTLEMTAAIDLGSTRTAVAFSVNGEALPLKGQELTRRLVMPRGEEQDALLAALAPAEDIPTAVTITGAGEELFTDGYVYRAASVEALERQDAHRLRASLKWRSDAESIRARRLLLHQVMLQAAMTARLAGAASILWRVSIADEMADEGRTEMLRLTETLAADVAAQTGLPLAAGKPAVTWTEESTALAACLRGEDGGRGSFVAADLGGSSTKLHLWIQGQHHPEVGAVLMEGVQTTLLAALYAQPRRLLEDFADCGDERLLQAVLALCDQMNPDLACTRQTDKLGLMLDALLDNHHQSIAQHLNVRLAAQNVTFLQSVLLETESAILFIAGLMLAQAGDNTMINHRLPADMTVCLSGRGAWMLESLLPAMRNSLQHLAHSPLRMDHPVRFVTLRTARQPAGSVATGLAITRDLQRVSEAPMLRTRESFSGLMRQMILQMVAAFPMHMWALHEGLFDWQGTLTPAGEDTIRRVASMCYGDGEDIPASILAFVRGMRETPILPDAALIPEA